MIDGRVFVLFVSQHNWKYDLIYKFSVPLTQALKGLDKWNCADNLHYIKHTMILSHTTQKIFNVYV